MYQYLYLIRPKSYNHNVFQNIEHVRLWCNSGLDFHLWKVVQKVGVIKAVSVSSSSLSDSVGSEYFLDNWRGGSDSRNARPLLLLLSTKCISILHCCGKRTHLKL